MNDLATIVFGVSPGAISLFKRDFVILGVISVSNYNWDDILKHSGLYLWSFDVIANTLGGWEIPFGAMEAVKAIEALVG